jgi:hypothetical protein
MGGWRIGGWGMGDGGYRIPETGNRKPETGNRIPDTGNRKLTTECLQTRAAQVCHSERSEESSATPRRASILSNWMSNQPQAARLHYAQNDNRGLKTLPSPGSRSSRSGPPGIGTPLSPRLSGGWNSIRYPVSAIRNCHSGRNRRKTFILPRFFRSMWPRPSTSKVARRRSAVVSETCGMLGSPCDSRRLAILTVSPHKS